MIPGVEEELEPEAVEELADELAPSTWEELDARRALIALGATERELTRLKRLEKAVVEPYHERQRELAKRCSSLRANVQHFVEQHGNVDFPDVAAAHLRTNPRRFRAADLEALARIDFVDGDGDPLVPRPIVRQELKTELVLDEEAFELFAGALEPREVERELGGGGVETVWLMIDTASGAVVDGIEYVPESKSLVVRGL